MAKNRVFSPLTPLIIINNFPLPSVILHTTYTAETFKTKQQQKTIKTNELNLHIFSTGTHANMQLFIVVNYSKSNVFLWSQQTSTNKRITRTFVKLLIPCIQIRTWLTLIFWWEDALQEILSSVTHMLRDMLQDDYMYTYTVIPFIKKHRVSRQENTGNFYYTTYLHAYPSVYMTQCTVHICKLYAYLSYRTWT